LSPPHKETDLELVFIRLVGWDGILLVAFGLVAWFVVGTPPPLNTYYPNKCRVKLEVLGSRVKLEVVGSTRIGL